MKGLTRRQKEVVEFIRDYIQEHSYPPTIRDIASNFSISVKAAFDHVKALEKKQIIKSDLNRSRSLEILAEEFSPIHEAIAIPLLGSVAAGMPLLTEENLEGTLSISAEMLGNGDFFALRVKGDSMINAGIFDGDYAIIKQTNTASNGSIVVAWVQDDAVTLKRLYIEKNRVRLQAENDAYPPIYTQDIRIAGKLQLVIRDYS
ncbi:MAG: transcriptional repressor LexA [Spirochaetales bacterium]|nr:transcriptional repressor LexA [Spirochaetales bacterium]